MASKTQILDRLRSQFQETMAPELVETLGVLKKYLFHYLDTGKDQRGQPIARKGWVSFYVLNEGAAQEAAYFDNESPFTTMDNTIVAANPNSPTLNELYKLYSSTDVRAKVRGALLNAAAAVYFEGDSVANHTARLAWSIMLPTRLEDALNQAMSKVCVDSTMLTGVFTDSTIQNIVNSYITTWALNAK